MKIAKKSLRILLIILMAFYLATKVANWNSSTDLFLFLLALIVITYEFISIKEGESVIGYVNTGLAIILLITSGIVLFI
ncbi:hypothetical protein [Halobacillus halophilus]|uniref:hypothetical protein n=1 Tax=Halobacillus halophilus TaxID=1570 RepID=UPI001CD35DDE|nr:hypothetical protein [Halobacillus halophilus]MCA1010677.1 hypothetical protein [Halobacillus halophilus]